MEDAMARKGRRRASIANALQKSLIALQQQAKEIQWPKVVRASFMLLFIAYPGTEAACFRRLPRLTHV